MIQLNLLPDLKKEFIKAQKNKSFVVSLSIVTTVVALGLSILMFLYVNVIQNVQINLATDEIKKKSQDLNNTPDLGKYLTIQNQLAALPKLHEEKGIQSRLLGFLNVLNPSPPNNINLLSLQISALDKTMLFVGTSANFEALNIFVDTLKNADVTYILPGDPAFRTEKMFNPVLIQSSGLSKVNDKALVSFTVIATYVDAVVGANSDGITVKVPKITTTGSVTRSPKPEIFNSDGSQQ